MGRVGHDDFGALGFAISLVEGTDNHQACELAMGACTGFEGEIVETGEGRETMAQGVVDGCGALYGVGRLQRVEIGEAWHISHFFVDLWVVLHGAAAKWVEAIVDTKVVAAMIGVVANYCELVDFGQFCLVGTTERCRNIIMLETVLRKRISTSSFL